MLIKKFRTIHGPNVFHHRPVIMMTIDIGEYRRLPSNEIKGFNEKLLKILPTLNSHHCSLGKEGGFVERLYRGTYMAHIIEHVALELSELAGIAVNYGKSVYAHEGNQYNVIVRFKNESAMTYLLETAFNLVNSILTNTEFNLDEKINQARRIVSRTQLGPSTQAIVDAAQKRGIPWRRLNDYSLIQLGWGKHIKRIEATTSSQTSSISVGIAQDKDLTKKLLEEIQIPTPQGEVVGSLEEAKESFNKLTPPLVLKPLDGNHGRGVVLDVSTMEALEKAYLQAAKESKDKRTVLVEENIKGKDFRVLLVNSKVIAVANRIPASVVGNGKLTLQELIYQENDNPLRGEGHEKPLTKIEVEAAQIEILKTQGIELTTIISAGQAVQLRQTANLSTGGKAVDVTDLMHPELKSMCERASRYVGLDICGIDLIAEDITKSPDEQSCAIIEVNAGPGIRMHEFPSEGQSRPVGERIMDSLFPTGQGRIPVASITGTNGKTTVTRLLGHLQRQTGQTVGMTTTEGIYLNEDKIISGDTTGPISARTILNDPSVDVAIFETARGGICKRGLAYDYSDVGIMTNVHEDHIGQDGIESVEDLLHIKSLVAERVRAGGKLIINADDEQLFKLSQRADIKADKEIIYFSLQPHAPRVKELIQKNFTVYYMQDNHLCVAEAGKVYKQCSFDHLGFTYYGKCDYQVSNVLAAVAGARAMDVDWKLIEKGLESFCAFKDNSGRGNIYKVDKGYIMIDYGHNAHALKSLCDNLSQLNISHVTGIISLPGDRKDEIIVQTAQIIDSGFDKIILKEDIDLRGREAGEVTSLLYENLDTSNDRVEVVPDEEKALAKAVEEMPENGMVVLLCEKFDNTQEVLNSYNAKPLESFKDLVGNSYE
jgi:cyanophycin synthetase